MKKIVVLMGGWSAERAVSLESGRCVADALKKQHDHVKAVDVGDAPNRSWMDALDDNTIVFNALHGTWGEDGTVQGLLESMHIPHTHSSVHASAIAMDKHASASIASYALYARAAPSASCQKAMAYNCRCHGVAVCHQAHQ